MRELSFNKPRELYNSFLNLLLVFLIAGILSTSYMLDWPDEIQAARDTAAAARDAREAAEAWARFEVAAQAMCGENAGWELLADGRVQCFTKRGKKTRVRML